MAKKYNFYFYPFNWEWRNVSIDKIKNLFEQYYGLFKEFLGNAYFDFSNDILADCVQPKRYKCTGKIYGKWNKKTVLSICEVKE